MLADAQRDGRPAEYRWRPLINAAKFGWRPLLECRAVMLTLPMYTVIHKECGSIFMTITLEKLVWFLWFLHRCKQEDFYTQKTSRLVFTAQLRPQFRMPPVRIRGMMRMQHFSICTSVVDCRCTTPSRRQCCRCTLRWLLEWQTSKCISSISFVRIESNFFTIHRRHRCKKMMDQNFEIRILWFFKIFWNFQKGVVRSLCGRSGPLWSRPN